MSEINDRGNIKWNAMMMPEHIQLLKDYWDSTERKQSQFWMFKKYNKLI